METNQIKKVLYIGSRDTDLQNSIKNLLNGRQDVVVSTLELPELRWLDEQSKLKIIKWNEKEKMAAFISNPAKIAATLEKAEKMYELVKELKAMERFAEIMKEVGTQELGDMSETQVSGIQEECRIAWNGWFSLKDMVEASTVSYKEARELLDLYYAFGFTAIREIEGNTTYTFLLSDEMKTEYVGLLLNEKKDEIKVLENLLKGMKAKKTPTKRVKKAETEAQL